MKPKLQAIIFDMDGVLLDSPKYNLESFNRVLSRYKVKIPENIFAKKYLGGSLRDQLLKWKIDYPQIPQNLDLIEFSSEALKHQVELFKHELKPNKYIQALLSLAKNDGIKTAVATSSTKERANIILKSLEILDNIEVLVTAEDVEKHKPNPDIFLKAAEMIDVAPENCVVIEDATDGILAANNAGMKSVAKLTNYHTKEDFVDANYIFDDFKNLKLSDLEKLYI